MGIFIMWVIYNAWPVLLIGGIIFSIIITLVKDFLDML